MCRNVYVLLMGIQRIKCRTLATQVDQNLISPLDSLGTGNCMEFALCDDIFGDPLAFDRCFLIPICYILGQHKFVITFKFSSSKVGRNGAVNNLK